MNKQHLDELNPPPQRKKTNKKTKTKKTKPHTIKPQTKNPPRTRFVVDIDECDPPPCNSGRCIDLVNGYTCVCDDGYEGEVCDVGKCGRSTLSNILWYYLSLNCLV